MLLCLSQGHARAASVKVESLTDKELASVEGGFCLIETCQTGKPTGKCQTHPPTFQGLCLPKTCSYLPIEVPLVGEVEVCTLRGQYTCTDPGGYRACITGSLLDVCLYSSINVCGTIAEPFCSESLKDHTCTCSVNYTETSCDWTNCIP
jgi:bacteriocin-like protein